LQRPPLQTPFFFDAHGHSPLAHWLGSLHAHPDGLTHEPPGDKRFDRQRDIDGGDVDGSGQPDGVRGTHAPPAHE
jgi:hypothetical protein